MRRFVRQGERADEGFTLMELIVAMMVIGGVLMMLMAVQTSALVTTIHAKQRQQGTAVANQVMEQLRALPWATLQKGLHPDFSAASGGDPNVSSGRLIPAHDSSINEVLVTESTQVTDAPPLAGPSGSNLTMHSDPAVPGVDFAARTYVTVPSDLATGVLILSVIVTWTEQSSDTERFAIARSAAFNPQGGCGDNTTQPFLGACQALLDSDAGAQGVSVTFTGYDPNDLAAENPVLPGSSTWRALYATASSSATLVSGQSATSTSRVTSGGSASTEAVETKAGMNVASNAASTDVGAAGAPPSNPADVAVNGAVSANQNFSSTPGGLGITTNPPSSLTGYARAKAGGGCVTGIPTGQPCSLGTTSSEGSSSATLSIPGGSITTVNMSGVSTRNAWTGRFATLPGTVPGVGCSAIAGPGCVSSGASRTFGTISLGLGSWQKMDGTAGPGSFLARITGFSDSVLVEHGEGRGAINPTLSRSGTLSYWNGTTMASVSLGASQSTTLTVPEVKMTVGGGEIIASGTITVSPASTTRSGSVPCKTDGCSVTTEMPSVSMAITYRVVSTPHDYAVIVGTDLGSVRANAKFKAAPDA